MMHSLYFPAFNHKGCYVDDPLRALPDVIGKWPKVQPSVALANCFAAVKAKGLKVFGIQYDGECYSRYTIVKQLGRKQLEKWKEDGCFMVSSFSQFVFNSIMVDVCA